MRFVWNASLRVLMCLSLIAALGAAMFLCGSCKNGGGGEGGGGVLSKEEIEKKQAEVMGSAGDKMGKGKMGSGKTAEDGAKKSDQ